jgi:phosphoadenosine phosphosulfate reductase
MRPLHVEENHLHDLDRWMTLADADLIAGVYESYGDTFAVVSSFGTESAVLLHLAATVDPNIPVIFLNTGKLFGETLRYRRTLSERLGLTRITVIEPDERAVAAEDPKGALWLHNPNACCALRKVRPLAQALRPLSAWASGRKAYQGAMRSKLGTVELDGQRLKINPLANWSRTDIENYFAKHELPPHPLEADGYASVGCMPCTTPVAPGENARAGRWRDQDKTECGIHLVTELEAAT